MKDFLNKMQKNEEKINLPTGEKKKKPKNFCLEADTRFKPNVNRKKFFLKLCYLVLFIYHKVLCFRQHLTLAIARNKSVAQ